MIPDRIEGLMDPEACTSMAQVRAGVDQLDRLLVEIMTRRQDYMEAAARIKPELAQVRDNARIEDVVTKVLAHAKLCGLSLNIAEPVWRQLIEACIAYETQAWHRLRGI
jgi:isochorismate pyruvate lyase